MIPRLRTMALVAVALALVVTGTLAARAAAGTFTAHLAGLETGRKTPLEVVVFNTTSSAMTLDLRLLDGAGNELLNRSGGVVVGARGTAIVSVEEELARDLPKKTKAYSGLVAVELTGDSPFAPETAIVHATQYFGKRKSPKGAVVFRPLFVEDL